MDVIGWRKPYRGVTLNRSHPLVRGLAGCWLLNEGTGGAVFDYSGNGYHGTSVNQTPNWRGSDVGWAQELDGSTGYVNVGDVRELNSVDEFTFALIVDQYPLNESATLLRKRIDSSHRVELETGSGDLGYLTLWVGDDLTGNSHVTPYSPPVAAGRPFHLTVSYYGPTKTIRFYIDGVEQAATYVPNMSASTADLSGVDLRVGNSTNSWNGGVSFLAVYSRALHPEEAAWLAREPYGMFAPDPRAWAEASAALLVPAPVRFLDAGERINMRDARELIRFRDRTARLHPASTT